MKKKKQIFSLLVILSLIASNACAVKIAAGSTAVQTNTTGAGGFYQPAVVISPPNSTAPSTTPPSTTSPSIANPSTPSSSGGKPPSTTTLPSTSTTTPPSVIAKVPPQSQPTAPITSNGTPKQTLPKTGERAETVETVVGLALLVLAGISFKFKNVYL